MFNENRVPYSVLKSWALEAYFEGCMNAVVKELPLEQALGYVAYTFEEGFDRPLENLMWDVIILVLSGRLDQERYERMRADLIDKIAENDLDDLLVGVPPDEVEEFKLDLRQLKLISREK